MPSDAAKSSGGPPKGTRSKTISFSGATEYKASFFIYSVPIILVLPTIGQVDLEIVRQHKTSVQKLFSHASRLGGVKTGSEGHQLATTSHSLIVEKPRSPSWPVLGYA